MSRIGKNPIVIPSGVIVAVGGRNVEVKGPKGSLHRVFHEDIKVEVSGSEVLVTIARKSKRAAALWGTVAAHIRNMIEGVTKGYEKKLEIEGIGYKAKLEGKGIVFALGFSHPVNFAQPEGITFLIEKNVITVSGLDKDQVGQTAAEIRALKKPEPYKGKGIHYLGEVVRRKAGKKAAAAA
ncbi:MAG: 50S ribosomal protein L6 [Candidatus Niyogibacteria bacterium]|nr:50S ribosomal protein L6 [Candidatus Niyogibacteria bacterium]